MSHVQTAASRSLRMTALRCFALLGLGLLSACTTQTPSGSNGPAPAIVQTSPPWQSAWSMVKAKLDSERGARAEGLNPERGGAVMRVLHRGAYLSVAAIRVDGVLPAPSRDAAEALVVVEGQGTLTAGGAEHPLSAGTIAVLPAGQRGAIRATRGGLYALVIRAQGHGPSGASAGKVIVAGVEEALPSALIDNAGGNHAYTVGSVSGELTVRTLSISGTVGRHVHLHHDEFVFLIRGWGTMGLGSEGSARQFISYPMRERSMALVPFGSPHGYSDESDQTLVISVQSPSAKAGEEDSYPVPQRGEIGASVGSRARDKVSSGFR